MKRRHVYSSVYVVPTSDDNNYLIQNRKLVLYKNIDWNRNFSCTIIFHSLKKAKAWFNNLPIGIHAVLEKYDLKTRRSKTWKK